MTIEIQRLIPPVSDIWCDRLTRFLWHKGSPWIEDIRRRLETGDEVSVDRLFVAQKDGSLAGHVWYTSSRSVPWLGLIGHVYTPPACRLQGIARQLLVTALRAFHEDGGEVLQLFTSTPYTIALYEQLGFENLYSNQAYHERDWFMCSPRGARDGVPDRWQSSPTTIRELADDDLPAYCLLYNIEHATRLKDWAQRIGFGLEAELAFINALHKQAHGTGVCYTLASSGGLSGVASLVQHDFPHHAHVGQLDVYVHESFRQRTAELVTACLAQRDRLAIELVYAAAIDPPKCRLFQELGFQLVMQLPRHYRVAAQRFDLSVFRYGG